MTSAGISNARAVGAASGAESAVHGDDYGNYKALAVITDAIPDALKSAPWAVWRAVPRDDGKVGKPPCNPLSGVMIGANKPHLWGTYVEALTTYENGGWSGMGVLLVAGSGIVGIDLDDIEAIAQRGSPLRKLLKQAQDTGIYIERSPSGTGARVFVRGKLPGDKGRRKGGIELYSDARFLTVTGRGKGDVIEAQWLVDGLLEIIGGHVEPVPITVVPGEADAGMIDALCTWAADNHARLWEGHWNDPPGAFGGTVYPSQSEADYALLGHIIREGTKYGVVDPSKLAATVVAVFERSGLYRPEKHRQIETYAVPKLVSAALESIMPVAGHSQAVIEFASAEPGDIIAGKLFADENREQLRYVAQAGHWMKWDGTRWLWCACGEEMAEAKNVAASALKHGAVLYAQDKDKHQKRMAFATRLQNLPRLEAMIELAKSEPGMTIGHVAELDSDPWLLGTRNGVVNLKDGTLLKPAPAMLMTRQAAAEYHRDAQCPRWLKFLDQVFDGDKETVRCIQRFLGYTLTGVTTEEVLLICYGGGANGKSVFANVISEIMADYGQMAPPSLLTVRKDGDSGPRNDVARLCGARLVQINELNQGDRLDEQVVKMLAGREMLSARFLHKEFFDFKPTAKPWLRTNHRPVITGEDDGIWRRIMLIPFKRKFSESERDPWLEQKLLEERDGILAWLVDGCLDWKKHGLKPSALIRRESATYRTESDLLGEFLDERTDSAPNGKVEQTEAFSRWRTWAEVNGVRAGSKKSFTRKLAERGFAEARSNGKRFYTGLVWKSS